MHLALSLTRLTGILQGKSSAFSTAQKTTRGSNKIYYILPSKHWEVSVEKKATGCFVYFLFLKKGGIEDMDRQPKTSAVLVFPLKPLQWSQRERGLGTQWSGVLLGSSNSCVPVVNSCLSVTSVHLFGTDRIHENNTVLSNHGAIQRTYYRQRKSYSQAKIVQREGDHEKEERKR